MKKISALFLLFTMLSATFAMACDKTPASKDAMNDTNEMKLAPLPGAPLPVNPAGGVRDPSIHPIVNGGVKDPSIRPIAPPVQPVQPIQPGAPGQPGAPSTPGHP